MERMYVLKVGDDVVAYARLDPDVIAQEMGGRNCWYLASLFVSVKWRGQGYSHTLLDQIVAAADQERAELTLGVDPPHGAPLDAAALRRLYRRYGFSSRRTNLNVMQRKPMSTDLRKQKKWK
jgi:GNAT superfamily N-acetyltransferase